MDLKWRKLIYIVHILKYLLWSRFALYFRWVTAYLLMDNNVNDVQSSSKLRRFLLSDVNLP
jgi:hypothetical protein